MGKWCRVKCSCSNRRPLPGSDISDYSDYVKLLKKPRLAKTEQEWKEKVRSVFECGHRSGNAVEFWPGDIISLGQALEIAFRSTPQEFEIFRRTAAPENYDDELLAISSDEAAAWLLETQILNEFIRGETYLGWHPKIVLDREIEQYGFLYGNLHDVISSVEKLCRTSLTNGTSIEFLL